MRRTNLRWIVVLLIVGTSAGAGCSGENGGSETDQDGVGQSAVETAPAPVLPSPGVMTSAELMERLEGPEGPVVLDVRSPEEYAEGHIPGAINLPYDRVGASLDSLESFRGGEIVVYCRTGRRARVAENVLREAGFTRVFDLEGHMTLWNESDLPVAVPAVN